MRCDSTEDGGVWRAACLWLVLSVVLACGNEPRSNGESSAGSGAVGGSAGIVGASGGTGGFSAIGGVGGVGGAAGIGGVGGLAGSGGGGGAVVTDAAVADVSTGDAGSLPPPLERVQLGENEFGPYAEQASGRVVRFVAVGDTGTGDEFQKQVADAIARKCELEGCDFVLLLGDNIYEAGPIAVDDVQWQDKFETPYAMVDVPFYPVLGNHDVGVLLGAGYNPALPPIEVEYTSRSDKWNMPGAHYTLSVGDVGVVLYDSTALYNHVVQQGDQHAWIDAARDRLAATHRWVFAAAHHTYVSNGEHGNAGAYAYLDFDLGAEVKTFVDDNLCGQIDALFTGHDHSRQWLDPSLCSGTDVIVSGAGSKVRDLIGQNPNFYQSNTLGFFYGVVDGDTFTGQMVNELGEVNFERVLRK